MHLRKINMQEFTNKIYPRYKKDFPKMERMSYFAMKKNIQEEKFTVLILEEESNIYAYSINIAKNGYILIYYLATNKEYRGLGYGSKILELMQDYYKEAKVIYIEVERAGYGKNEEENIMREKRLAFYFRNGFQEINLVANIYKTDYELYVYPIKKNQVITAEEVKEIETNIYLELFGEKKVKKYVLIEKKKI